MAATPRDRGERSRRQPRGNRKVGRSRPCACNLLHLPDPAPALAVRRPGGGRRALLELRQGEPPLREKLLLDALGSRERTYREEERCAALRPACVRSLERRGGARLGRDHPRVDVRAREQRGDRIRLASREVEPGGTGLVRRRPDDASVDEAIVEARDGSSRLRSDCVRVDVDPGEAARGARDADRRVRRADGEQHLAAAAELRDVAGVCEPGLLRAFHRPRAPPRGRPEHGLAVHPQDASDRRPHLAGMQNADDGHDPSLASAFCAISRSPP